MYFCILILPFLSFISCFFFGRFIGIFGSCMIATLAIMCSAALALFMIYETAILGSTCNFVLISWLNSELLTIN